MVCAVAAKIKIIYGNQQTAARSGYGENSARLEFKLRDANSIFHEKNLLRAALQNVESAVLILFRVPRRCRAAKGIVIENFDGDVAEGPIYGVAYDVRKSCGRKTSFAVLQFHSGRSLVLHDVDDLRVAQSHVNIIMAVPMHMRFGSGINLDVEHAHRLIFQYEMMVRLRGDFNLGSPSLRRQQRRCEQKNEAFHAANCSTGRQLSTETAEHIQHERQHDTQNQ